MDRIVFTDDLISKWDMLIGTLIPAQFSSLSPFCFWATQPRNKMAAVMKTVPGLKYPVLVIAGIWITEVLVISRRRMQSHSSRNLDNRGNSHFKMAR